MGVEREVTLIMTTYNNHDFTKAALWAFKRFYPGVRVILADGGSTDGTIEEIKNEPIPWGHDRAEVVVGYNKTSEEMCNIASVLVDTPYVLFMDNDCKVTGPKALPLLVEALEVGHHVACTGAYAVKVTDWNKHTAFTGTVFNDHMRVSATARYFQLHRTECFRKVWLFPTKEWFYRDMPFDPRMKQGCQGDMSISRYYEEAGLWTLTPRETVPVIHWGAAKVTAQDDEAVRGREIEKWYFDHVTHTRLDPRPLNEWERHINEITH